MADPSGSTEAPVPSKERPPAAAEAAPQALAPTGIWERIKEHKVVQWTLAYAAAAYTLLHGTEMISEAMEWPHLIARILTLVLLLGVPVVITLAWYHGAKSLRRVSGPELTIITILLVIAGSVLWALTRGGSERSPTPAAQTAHEASSGSAAPPVTAPVGVSLAVLPFVDMSPEHNQEYFSDGLSEEILNQLAQIRSLRVTGRTSSFSFKGKNEDLRVIGEKLGVANLLEGSIRKDGNQLRITAQLIDSKDGAHLWSRTYDRELSGVFALQEEIAKDVARALSITLDIGEMSRAHGGTNSVEAYDKYLHATRADSFSPKELTQSSQFYREAVALDPAFARAWYGLFGTLEKTLLAIPENAVATRSEMAEVSARVVALAPDAWWTQSMRAEQFRQLHKWAEDEAAVNRAVAAAPPTEFSATQAYVLFLWAVGRAKEAAAYMERAHQADPLSYSNSLYLQNALELAGRRTEAQAEYERARDIGFSDASLDFFALMRLWSRKDADPVAIRTQFRTLLQHDAGRMRIHGSLADKLDNKESARATLRQAFEDPVNQYGTSMLTVALYADHFGDKDLALAALRRSMVDLRSLAIGYIWFPYESGLRTDPRFKDILRDMGLVDYFRTSGNWGDFCKPVGKDDFECH